MTLDSDSTTDSRGHSLLWPILLTIGFLILFGCAGLMFIGGLGVWWVLEDDWGVSDHGHTVYVFMAAFFQTLAILLGGLAFVLARQAICRFRNGRWATPLNWIRFVFVLIGAVGLVWTGNILAESQQTTWAVSGDGVSAWDALLPFTATVGSIIFLVTTRKRRDA